MSEVEEQKLDEHFCRRDARSNISRFDIWHFAIESAPQDLRYSPYCAVGRAFPVSGRGVGVGSQSQSRLHRRCGQQLLEHLAQKFERLRPFGTCCHYRGLTCARQDAATTLDQRHRMSTAPGMLGNIAGTLSWRALDARRVDIEPVRDSVTSFTLPARMFLLCTSAHGPLRRDHFTKSRVQHVRLTSGKCIMNEISRLLQRRPHRYLTFRPLQ